MDLKTYIKSLDKKEFKRFASSCGTTRPYLRKIAGGFGSKKAPGEALAISIERESGGKVKCEELRPDVDWAFLRGTSAA